MFALSGNQDLTVYLKLSGDGEGARRVGFTDKEVEESSSQDGGGRGEVSGDETKLAGMEAGTE